jgi:hypothetical protein
LECSKRSSIKLVRSSLHSSLVGVKLAVLIQVLRLIR